MRRWVAAIALIEVLNVARSQGSFPTFLVKGGFALEFRFRNEARASRDVDIVANLEPAELLDAAVQAFRESWSGFSFGVKGTPERREHSYRFDVNARYLGSNWSTFEVELVFGEVDAEELVPTMDLSTVGLVKPSPVPCMSVSEQIAQKLHAASDPAEDRPRDLLDIYILDTRLPHDDQSLRMKCIATFERRATHPWPPNIALRPGWDLQLSDLLSKLALAVSPSEVESSVQRLVARLLTLSSTMN